MVHASGNILNIVNSHDHYMTGFHTACIQQEDHEAHNKAQHTTFEVSPYYTSNSVPTQCAFNSFTRGSRKLLILLGLDGPSKIPANITFPVCDVLIMVDSYGQINSSNRVFTMFKRLKAIQVYHESKCKWLRWEWCTFIYLKVLPENIKYILHDTWLYLSTSPLFTLHNKCRMQ